MTKPTDAEILALLAEKKPTPSLVFLAKDDAKLADLQAAAVAIAREVLAKWGNSVVAGEPVAWLDPWTGAKVTTDYDAYGKHGIPLYTAPPAHPGAGRGGAADG